MIEVSRLSAGVDPRMMSFSECAGICFTCKQKCRDHDLNNRAACVQVLNDLDKKTGN